MKISHHHNSRPDWTPAARKFDDGPRRKFENESGPGKKSGLTFTSGMDRLAKSSSAATNNGPGQASKAVPRASAADILASQRSLAEARMLQSRAESLRWSPSASDRALGLSLMRDAAALMQRVDSGVAPQRLEGTGNGVAPQAESASPAQAETPAFEPASPAPASASESCESPVVEPASPACSPEPCSPAVDTGLIQAIQAVTLALQSMVVR